MRYLRASVAHPPLVQADARRLPFPPGAFDIIVATFPAEYIAEAETWEAFRYVLSPQGRIILLLGARPGGLHPLNVFSRLLFRITGQLNREEALKARLQLTEKLEDIGLELMMQTRSIGKTEIYLAIAEAGQKVRSSDQPAV